MTLSRRTILVGGGGFARELLVWAADCAQAGTLAPVGGYLDDGGETLAALGYDLPYLGSSHDYVPFEGDGFVLAIGSPAGKRAAHGRLSERGGTFPRLIHPTARIAPTARVDEGCVLLLMAVAGPESHLERFVCLNGGSGVGHDGRVGEFTTLSSHVDVTGGVVVGRDVMIGSKALLMPRVRIGDGATIGAGSIVYRTVKPGATTYSAPARTLKVGDDG